MQNQAVSSLDLNKIDFFFPSPCIFCLPSADWCQTFRRKRLPITIKLGELLQPGFFWKKESRKWERKKKRCKTIETHFAKENRAAKIVARSSGRLTSHISAHYCHKRIQIPTFAALDNHHSPPPTHPTWPQQELCEQGEIYILILIENWINVFLRYI